MAQTQPVLLFDAAAPRAADLSARLTARGFEVSRRPLETAAGENGLRSAGLAAIVLDEKSVLAHIENAQQLLDRLIDEHVATLVWGLPTPIAAHPAVENVPADATLDEVVGRIMAISNVAPHIQRMEQELNYLDRLARQLNRHFMELDQELRLAGRLQRDFLPRRFPEVPKLAFAGIFRPATWVSGDLYDVFRVDEHHIAFFVADAMGHGLAAGLLTMFMRQALAAKQITGRDYRVIEPAEALAHLNDGLLRQQLPNQQFVTAVYGLLDVRNLELRVARGGHPYPLLIARDGGVRELLAQGGLLGLADVEAHFSEVRSVMAPGEKLVLYTDGVEEVLIIPQESEEAPPRLQPHVQEWVHLGAEAFVQALTNHLDHAEGSLHPNDDVTLVVIERTE